MCKYTAEAIVTTEENVLVASTGVIGQPLPIEPIRSHMRALVEGLSYDGANRAATAIMTTDTFSKEVAVEFSINGVKCRLGGMAKGSGMIHPNMATTLNFITTDAAISSEMLQSALSDIVKTTYNCLSIDVYKRQGLSSTGLSPDASRIVDSTPTLQLPPSIIPVSYTHLNSAFGI